jgi:hypothetical protein
MLTGDHRFLNGVFWGVMSFERARSSMRQGKKGHRAHSVHDHQKTDTIARGSMGNVSMYKSRDLAIFLFF